MNLFQCHRRVGEKEEFRCSNSDPMAIANEGRHFTGLVTDVGGAGRHYSIVAQEYGIPAVMGTGVGTSRINHGQRITVDGDAGTVNLNEENS